MSTESVNGKTLASARSLGASFTTDGVSISDRLGFSIQAVLSGGGTPIGTVKLQWSNDNVNYEDIPSQSKAFTDDGNTIFNVSGCYVKWVRLDYARTSGTGVMTAKLSTKD